jgi:ribonuclease P protein component
MPLFTRRALCSSELNRIQKKAGFQSVFCSLARVYTSRHVVIYILRSRLRKFGFVDQKKVGNAVKRNRCKKVAACKLFV